MVSAPDCPNCKAPWTPKNLCVWDVDDRDQCEDGRFEPPTYSAKIWCVECKHEWFRVEQAYVEYGE